MAQENSELIELMMGRACMYGMLARLFREEVDADTLKELQSMKFPVRTGNELVDKGFRQLFDYLKTAWADSVTELAIDYVRCFIGHGVNGYSAAYPFESVYTSERRLMMQEARADVLRIFRENGFKRDRWNEGEDHIALELEFVQRIAAIAYRGHPIIAFQVRGNRLANVIVILHQENTTGFIAHDYLLFHMLRGSFGKSMHRGNFRRHGPATPL